MPKPMMIIDDQLESTAPLPPLAKPDFDLPYFAATPMGGNFGPEQARPTGKGRQFVRIFTSKMAMTLFASFVITGVMNIDRLCKVAQFVASIAVHFADPEMTARVKRLFGKGEDAVNKAEERQENKPGFLDRAKEKAKNAAAGAAIEGVKDKVEDAKDNAVEKAIEAKEEVKSTISSLGDRMSAGAQAAQRRANEAAAAAEQAVEQAATRQRAIAWQQAQNAPNARCPFCSHPTHLEHGAHRPRLCTRCNRTYYPIDARAAFRQRGFR